MSNSKLQEIYYQPQHLWKGEKALKKLKTSSSLKPKQKAAQQATLKQWLSRQAFWQVHLDFAENSEIIEFNSRNSV